MTSPSPIGAGGRAASAPGASSRAARRAKARRRLSSTSATAPDAADPPDRAPAALASAPATISGAVLSRCPLALLASASTASEARPVGQRGGDDAATGQRTRPHRTGHPPPPPLIGKQRSGRCRVGVLGHDIGRPDDLQTRFQKACVEHGILGQLEVRKRPMPLQDNARVRDPQPEMRVRDYLRPPRSMQQEG